MPIRTAAAATARRCRSRSLPSWLSDSPKLPTTGPRSTPMQKARRGMSDKTPKLDTTGPRRAAMEMARSGFSDKIVLTPMLPTTGPRSSAMQMARRGFCNKVVLTPMLPTTGRRSSAMQMARRGFSKVFHSPKLATTGPRPGAMQMARRGFSDKTPAELRDKIRELEEEIRRVDAKSFARFKDVSMDNGKTCKRLTNLANQISEGEKKRAQEYASQIVHQADKYFKDINVAWKAAFGMMTVGGGLGFAFLGEVKEGWQEDCSKKNEQKMDEKVATMDENNEKKMDEKLAKMKEDIIGELKAHFEQEKK